MTQHNILLEKPLPHSHDTERITLGAVFLDEKMFARIAHLSPPHYHNQTYRLGFQAMSNLFLRKVEISAATVLEEMKAIQPNTSIALSEVINWTYGLPRYSNLETEINILKDKFLKRRIINQCNELAQSAAREEDLGTVIAGNAANAFQDIYGNSFEKQKPTVQLAEGLQSNYERWGKMLRKEIVTVETGIQNVDNQLTGGGLEKGMFHVIGARPTKGKTSIALDMASHNIFQNKTVVFFTLELSRDVLLDRFVSPLAGIPRYKITSKWMNDYDFKRLVAVSEHIKQFPLHINHKARSAKDMRLALKEVAASTGGEIDLIIVDFLTKMQGTRGSKYESVSYNANALAEFAPEFNAAVVCLSQFSRPEKSSKDERPQQTDFRDSGEIEELGRTIFGLWGDDKSNGLRQVNFSCLKQGEGAEFDEQLIFDTDFMTFGGRRNLIQNEN